MGTCVCLCFVCVCLGVYVRKCYIGCCVCCMEHMIKRDQRP